MKITYIYHSCFLVELDNCVFLFDYFKGKLPQFSKEKPLYVFASHKHGDHFDHKIFQLALEYPKIQFVLSNDIKMNEKYMERVGIDKAVWDKILYVKKNETYQLGSHISLETLKSTDVGVAFIVIIEDRCIYHAGDLNWWTWNGETNQEYEEMTNAFQKEIGRIENRHFDVAFLPLDPRQEEKFHLGFDYFMKHTNTERAIPMHYWEQPEIIDKLIQMPEAKEYQNRIIMLKMEGEQYEF